MLLLYYYRIIEKHKKILFNICLLTKLSKTYELKLKITDIALDCES